MNEISKFYPIINASYQTREAQGKRQLMTYFLLISLLTLFLTFLLPMCIGRCGRSQRYEKSWLIPMPVW